MDPTAKDVVSTDLILRRWDDMISQQPSSLRQRNHSALLPAQSPHGGVLTIIGPKANPSTNKLVDRIATTEPTPYSIEIGMTALLNTLDAKVQTKVIMPMQTAIDHFFRGFQL